MRPVVTKKAFAVLPLVNALGIETTGGKKFAEELTTVLVQRDVPVVERTLLNRVLKELKLQHTKEFAPETAQRLGKQVGAFAVLAGSLVPKGRAAEAHIRLIKVDTGQILFAFSQRVPGNAREALRPDTVEFGGHRYWISDKKLVWHDAQAACQKMGGHLVCIETAEEQEFLEKITVPSKGAKRNPYWFGLRNQDGKLVWVNWQKARFFAWNYSGKSGKQELDTHIKKYSQIALNRRSGKWYFRDSPDFHYYFICEWDK